MKKRFVRCALALLIAAALLASALCAAAETAYARYESQGYGFSFEAPSSAGIYEQDGFVWVYTGESNSNFRMIWIGDGELDEAAFFAQTGAALREAMGDSMVSDPGDAPVPLELRGIAMDAMIYAYTDAESGAIVEGAYLWEQRSGYALLYGAAYLQDDADAVLSALVHASETFAFAESARAAEPDADFAAMYAHLNALSADMSAATQALTEEYSRSMENGDGEYAAAMLEYVERCQSAQAECAQIAAALEASPDWAQQHGEQYANAVSACRILREYLAFYVDYYHSSDPLMEYQARAAQGEYASQTELLDGITMYNFGPGHAYGMVGLMVDLEETGPVLLPSDALCYLGNIDEENPLLPPLRSYDYEGTVATIETIKELAKAHGAEIWPAHDTEWFQSTRKLARDGYCYR